MLLMECQSAEVVICLISAAAAIAAVIVAFCNNKILMYAEYTRRYQEIKLRILKNEIGKNDFQILYLDLCSEEFFMHKKRHLPKGVWEIWEEGMKHEVKGDYFELWQEHKDDYNPKFQEFFNEIVVNNAKEEDNLK